MIIKLKVFNSSMNYYEECLSIPLFYQLKVNQQRKIINILYKLIG